MVLAMAISFTACGGDDNDDSVSEDLATKITGTYAGTLSSGGYVIDDTYTVTISRVTDTVVSVYADFFGESVKFNVSYNSSSKIYTLTSSSYTNVSMTISGKTLFVSFTNKGGTMTTFEGSR